VEAHGDLDGSPLRLNVSLEHDKADIYHAVIQHADWKSAHADGDVTSGSDVAQAKGNVRFRMGQLSDLNWAARCRAMWAVPLRSHLLAGSRTLKSNWTQKML
jgi:hypothetical protein